MASIAMAGDTERFKHALRMMIRLEDLSASAMGACMHERTHLSHDGLCMHVFSVALSSMPMRMHACSQASRCSK